MKVKVEKENCIGCQTCVVMCPECFKMEGGIAEYVQCDSDCGCDMEQIAQSCPVSAIIVEK